MSGEIEPWTDILLRGVVSCIVDSGLPRDQLAAALRELAKRVEQNESVSRLKSEDVELFRCVCAIVEDWCSDPACASSSDGRPIPLRLQGDGVTLSDLILRQRPRSDFATVVSWMEKHDVLVAQDDGSYALKRSANLVMTQPSTSLAVHRLSTLVVQQLSAGIENLHLPVSARNIERDASVRHLPVRLLPAFNAWTKIQGQNYLEIIDSWLTTRNEPDSDEPTVEAGVHVYGYTGTPNASGRSRRKG